MHHEVVAFDLEHNGKDETWLAQVGTETDTVYIFDVVIGGSDILLALKPLLENHNIVKVIHDARSDSQVLFQGYDIVINNVYDTQVAHKKATDSNVQLGLNALLEQYGCGTNPRKEEFGKLFSNQEKTRELFTKRPMSSTVIEYADADVRTLCKAYRALVATVASTEERDDAQDEVEPPPVKWMEMRIKQDGTVQYLDPEELTSTGSGSKTPDLIGHEFQSLQEALPAKVMALLAHSDWQSISEIMLDVGKTVMATTRANPVQLVPGVVISRAHIDEALSRIAAVQTGSKNDGVDDDDDDDDDDYYPEVGEPAFSSDNRAGLPLTLHRISRIKNRSGQTIGLTYRIGRHIAGAADMIADLLARVHLDNRCKGLLLLGKPGVGKTSLLRDVISQLAGKMRVLVVDSSNEVAGDGDVPHPCIGAARRIQVQDRAKQHLTLIEAVQNHTPQVIVVDEVGTKGLTVILSIVFFISFFRFFSF